MKTSYSVDILILLECVMIACRGLARQHVQQTDAGRRHQSSLFMSSAPVNRR